MDKRAPCQRCGHEAIEPIVFCIMHPHKRDGMLIMSDGLAECGACGWDPNEKTFAKYEEQARQISVAYAYAQRRYRHDQTVSNSILIPLNVWIVLWRCNEDLSNGKRRIDLIGDLLSALVTENAASVSGASLVRIPAEAVLQCMPHWRAEQEKDRVQWENRPCHADGLASKRCRGCYLEVLCPTYKTFMDLECAKRRGDA